jgi:AAA domain, putative AbiEii toxin, Type IV TA system
MLEKLHLKNVGPAPELEMEFAPRLNIITGDNGLGKSFILDVAWWALTGDWLSESNSSMVNGQMIRPINRSLVGSIEYDRQYVQQKSKKNKVPKSDSGYFQFIPSENDWLDTRGYRQPELEHPNILVLQAHANSEFGISDSLRDSYGFSISEVWNGLIRKSIFGESNVCNGLIRDWSQWLLEQGAALRQLEKALEVLSPNEQEKLIATKSTRVSIDDVRDIPTLKMPYGQEVPVTHASSGIKRIISLAYLLVWTWQEHLRAAELRQLEPSKKMVLLIDELECHLHPQWQRKILDSLLNVVKEIMQDDVQIQIIATTHSPLVMASLEPLFDPKQDAWFDFNLVKGKVTLEKMAWYKRGGAEEWLTSEAFDLDSTGSLENARVKNLAAKALNNPKLSKKKFLELDSELRNVLPEMDEFWIRWRFIGEKKGYL